jgi:hypothetical protein
VLPIDICDSLQIATREASVYDSVVCRRFVKAPQQTFRIRELMKLLYFQANCRVQREPWRMRDRFEQYFSMTVQSRLARIFRTGGFHAAKLQ